LAAQSDTKDKIVMKPALLVIDVQKQFLTMMSKEDPERVAFSLKTRPDNRQPADS